MAIFSTSAALVNLLRCARKPYVDFLCRNAARIPVKAHRKEVRKIRSVDEKYDPQSDLVDFNNPQLDLENEVNDEVLSGKSKAVCPSGFPRFEKKGIDDSTLSRFYIEASCKNKRDKSGLMMLEGKRLITEALQAKIYPKAIFFSHLETVADLPLQSHTFIFQKVTYKLLQRWSKLETSPGVIGFFTIPNVTRRTSLTSEPITVICDNVRDPGNLGSILRVAAGAGCKEVLLLKGCVDLWDSKVLRSGAGSHFHLKIKIDLSWEDVCRILKPESRVYIADNSSCIQEKCEDNLYPSTENSGTTSPSTVKNLPLASYFNEDFSDNTDLFLVISGETSGVSNEVAELEKFYKVMRLHVPMESGVESLNVGTAAGILIYEMKRQLSKKTLQSSEGMAPVPGFQ